MREGRNFTQETIDRGLVVKKIYSFPTPSGSPGSRLAILCGKSNISKEGREFLKDPATQWLEEIAARAGAMDA